jgi:ElaB/YqjD/DUF883 family membrane-anchored ribosome-binding protein
MAGHTARVKARANQKLHEASERAGESVTRASDAVDRAKTKVPAPIQKAVDEKAGPVVRQGMAKAKPHRWQAVAVGAILIGLLVAARRRKTTRGEDS